MRPIILFLKRNLVGVVAPLVLIAGMLASDFDAPGIISFLLGAVGIVGILVHFFGSAGRWFSKQVSYGEAIANGLGPIMLGWVAGVMIRACILGILGKPL